MLLIIYKKFDGYEIYVLKMLSLSFLCRCCSFTTKDHHSRDTFQSFHGIGSIKWISFLFCNLTLTMKVAPWPNKPFRLTFGFFIKYCTSLWSQCKIMYTHAFIINSKLESTESLEISLFQVYAAPCTNNCQPKSNLNRLSKEQNPPSNTYKTERHIIEKHSSLNYHPSWEPAIPSHS